MNRRGLVTGGMLAATVVLAEALRPARADETGRVVPQKGFDVTHSEAEWHRLLTSAQFDVLRDDGTERPFTSPLLEEHRHGRFVCAGCDRDLFSSDAKFDSGTGWPSFWAPLPGAVREERDGSFGFVRTAIRCDRCGGHLGHVFDNGPKPTGLRYCMNGVALRFHTSGA